jgi:hypothetical protein
MPHPRGEETQDTARYTFATRASARFEAAAARRAPLPAQKRSLLKNHLFLPVWNFSWNNRLAWRLQGGPRAERQGEGSVMGAKRAVRTRRVRGS